MNNVEYSVHGWDDKHDLETNHDSMDWIAEDAASDYYDHHDGWEADWPLKIEIFIDGNSKGVFEIELEMSPTFNSSKVG